MPITEEVFFKKEKQTIQMTKLYIFTNIIKVSQRWKTKMVIV